MRQVLPLHPLDFCSTEQTRQYIRNRQADAASREAAQAPEGRGLVHIKTSRSTFPASRKLVAETSCPTGIPRSDEWLCPGRIPKNTYPGGPDAIEIDQHEMRLRRLKKNVITSARLHERDLRGSEYHCLFITLTYRSHKQDWWNPLAGWEPKQITSYINAVKLWYKRRGYACRYVWVLELTKKGRPHYHVMFWHPKKLSMPKADKRGWWPHGMTNTQKARNAVGYLAKYASKGGDFHLLPRGGRIYGIGGHSAGARVERAWWNLPVGVRRWGFPADRWRRAPGGGWVCRASGEWRASLWSVLLHGGRVFAVPRPRPTESSLDVLRLALSLQWQHMRF